MTTFSNPRLAALPCELMRGCSFADNLVTAATVLNNNGTEAGAGGVFDHGGTFAGNGYIYYDIVTQPSGFSVKVQFETTYTVTIRGPLISNAMTGQDGFWIYLTPTGVYAQHGNGSQPHTACEVAIAYADGEIHTVTYVVDMTGGTHTLYVDALAAVTESTAINEEIGTTETVLIGKYSTSRFTGTIYKPRIFNALLTQEEHDMYYEDGSPDVFWNTHTATARYKMDAFGEDNVGYYIWDSSRNLDDLTKGDGVTVSTMPLFDVDKYSFDLVDDYISDWPTWPAAYTVTAALSTPHEIFPEISQTNDTTLTDILDTSGVYWGYVHNLSVYPWELNQLQLYHAEYWHMYWLNRGRATGAYHRLITEGTCKLAQFLDGDRGVFTNMAPLHDAGIATLVTRGTTAADGCTFGSATSNVTFAHNTSQMLTNGEGTIAIYGTLDSVVASETAVDKGADYKFHFVRTVNGDTKRYLYLNAAYTYFVHGTYDEVHHMAVTWKTGFKPRFYVNGDFLAEGNAAVTPDDTDTTDLVIGNNNELSSRFQQTLKQVYIGDKALTDREIKALYEEAQTIGATIMEVGTRVEARRAPAVGAVDETVDPGDAFQLIDVTFIFDAAPTTSENITIVRVTGDSDEATEESYDPSLSTDLTHVFRFDKRFQEDVTIDIDYLNTDGNTITVLTQYQLDEQTT